MRFEHSDFGFRVSAFIVSTVLGVAGIFVAGRPEIVRPQPDRPVEVRWNWGWWYHPTPVVMPVIDPVIVAPIPHPAPQPTPHPAPVHVLSPHHK